MPIASLIACPSTPKHVSPQFRQGRFRNVKAFGTGPGKALRIIWRMLFDKPAEATPRQAVPVAQLTQAQLLAADDGSVFRLGHSTVLLKLRGGFWLTDPVFSDRASPMQWAGPKRFHAAPIGIDALPPIAGVILSHDHYDHLDYAAILALNAKTTHFITPLGVGDRLIEWGVDAAKVRQLDWWESTHVEGLRLVATPAQHFSGRGMFDGNSTLWASWVLLADDMRVFFSGDTGYFDGFKSIGERYGPFDLTMMETGAYDPSWPDVHMQPEETLQAHLDLRGKRMMPIHNGTFDLALHNWYDPFERIAALADAAGVPLATPGMGEALAIHPAQATARWWEQVRAVG